MVNIDDMTQYLDFEREMITVISTDFVKIKLEQSLINFDIFLD